MPGFRYSKDSIAYSITMLLLAMFSIQTGASIAKKLFPILGAEGTTCLRLGIAAVLLCAFWRPWRRAISRTERWSILVYGLSLGAMNFIFYLALERIPLGITVALEFTGPLALALWSSRKPTDFLWAALAIAGVVLVLPLESGGTALDPLGIVYALGAGVCWALYILFGQKAGASTHGGTVTALGMVAAAVLACPFGIAHAGGKLLDTSLWAMALAVAVLSSALPYSLEMVALKRLPTKTFGILMSLEPACAALSGYVLLGESLTSFQWLAIACIMLASFGSAWTAKVPAVAAN